MRVREHGRQVSGLERKSRRKPRVGPIVEVTIDPAGPSLWLDIQAWIAVAMHRVAGLHHVEQIVYPADAVPDSLAAPAVVRDPVDGPAAAVCTPAARPQHNVAAPPPDAYALALGDLSVDDLNARVRSPLTPQQRNAVDSELNRRQRVRNQDEQPSGAHDAELLQTVDSASSPWDEGSLLSDSERLH